MIRRILLLVVVVGAIFGVLMLFTYDIIKIDWIGFMEIQPSFRPMENPLPVPAQSIPVEGAAYVPGLGAPVNPIEADDVSVERGRILYGLHCAMCHGNEGRGDGLIGNFIVNPPANLAGEASQAKSDGTLFITISNGVTGKMPALNENLTVRERWDVVNFIRTLAP